MDFIMKKIETATRLSFAVQWRGIDKTTILKKILKIYLTLQNDHSRMFFVSLIT